MNKPTKPESRADFQRDVSLEPVVGKKTAREEPKMYAARSASPMDATQRPISILGWSLVFAAGLLLWSIIFYLV